MPLASAGGAMPQTLAPHPTEPSNSRRPSDGAQPIERLGWRVVPVVGVGTFMTTLDSSIVNISLPAMARAFGTPLSGVIEWVIIIYLVVIAGLLLTFGRLSDVLGRKPIWLAGLALFTCSSAVCGLSPSLAVLIGARAVQGIGGALIFAPSVALLTDAFPPEKRGRAIGMNALAVAVGVSAGPLLGGLITEYLSWRWIFFVNLPVGIAAVLASARWLPVGQRRSEKLDVPGAVLLALGLGGLTLALSFGQEWGWLSAPVIGCVVASLVGLIALVPVERRVGHPNINLDVVRQRAFAAALASLVLSFVALFAVSFLMPFYFENLRGFAPDRSGLLLTPLPLAIAVVAPLSGALADRLPSRWISSIGLAVACAGLFLLSQLDASSSTFDIIWRLALVGIGSGTFQSPNNRALMQAAPRGEQGEASGLLGTGRVVGQSLSVAIAGAVFGALGGVAANARLSQAVESGQQLPADQLMALQQTFVQGFHAALVVSCCVAAIGIFTSLVRPTN